MKFSRILKDIATLITFIIWICMTVYFAIPYLYLGFVEIIHVVKPWIEAHEQLSGILIFVWMILTGYIAIIMGGDEENE